MFALFNLDNCARETLFHEYVLSLIYQPLFATYES